MKIIFRLLFALLFVNNAYAQSIIPASGSIVPGITPIIGGTDKRVLFDDGGKIGESANLTFDKTNSILTLGADVNLVRQAANILAQRNSTSAQTSYVYNTYTDASNYERAMLSWSKNANRLSIGVEAAGTGSARAVDWYASTHTFYVNGSTAAWDIIVTGHLQARADNTYDIGASGANRPRNLYLAGSITGASGATFSSGNLQIATGAAYLWANGTNLQTQGSGIITLYNNGNSDFARLQFGGTTASFPSLKRSATALQSRLADDSAFGFIQGKIQTDTNYTAGTTVATGYLTLYDAAGTAYKVNACTGC